MLDVYRTTGRDIIEDQFLKAFGDEWECHFYWQNIEGVWNADETPVFLLTVDLTDREIYETKRFLVIVERKVTQVPLGIPFGSIKIRHESPNKILRKASGIIVLYHWAAQRAGLEPLSRGNQDTSDYRRLGRTRELIPIGDNWYEEIPTTLTDNNLRNFWNGFPMLEKKT